MEAQSDRGHQEYEGSTGGGYGSVHVWIADLDKRKRERGSKEEDQVYVTNRIITHDVWEPVVHSTNDSTHQADTGTKFCNFSLKTQTKEVINPFQLRRMFEQDFSETNKIFLNRTQDFLKKNRIPLKRTQDLS